MGEGIAWSGKTARPGAASACILHSERRKYALPVAQAQHRLAALVMTGDCRMATIKKSAIARIAGRHNIAANRQAALRLAMPPRSQRESLIGRELPRL
jgi:hypothetical protein